MRKLKYVATPAEASEVFPKVYYEEGENGTGTYHVIEDMPVEFNGYLLELLEGEEWAEGRNLYKAVTPEAMSLLSITMGGDGPSVTTAWSTSWGTSPYGDTWINAPIPEPTLPTTTDSGDEVFAFSTDNAYLLDNPDSLLTTYEAPIEYKEFLALPGLGVRINLDTLESVYSDTLELDPSINFPFEQVTTGSNVTYSGNGRYAYSVVYRTVAGGVG